MGQQDFKIHQFQRLGLSACALPKTLAGQAAGQGSVLKGPTPLQGGM